MTTTKHKVWKCPQDGCGLEFVMLALTPYGNNIATHCPKCRVIAHPIHCMSFVLSEEVDATMRESHPRLERKPLEDPGP
jgi:hypothetical protein